MEKYNTLPTEILMASETGCCPKFDPDRWDNKYFELDGVPMIKVTGRSILYVPFNIGSIMSKTQEIIDASGAGAKDKYLILAHDVSPWKCDYYFMVAGPIEGQENVTLKGRFISKVYEGEFSAMKGWAKEMKQFVEEEGYGLKTLYSFYTTCPKCAKIYGKNYVVLLAEV